MLFEKFSTPYEGDFLGLAEIISGKLFARACERARGLGAELPATAGASSAPSPTPLGHWSPELGVVRLVMDHHANPPPEWLGCQLQIAAFLNRDQPAISFEAQLPHPLTVAGHEVPAGRVSVEGRDGWLRVQGSTSSAALELRQFDDCGLSPLWVDAAAQATVRLGSGARAIPATHDWLAYWASDAPRGVLVADAAAHAGQVEAAMDLMETLLPDYYVWTAAMLKQSVGVEREGSAASTNSASFMYRPAHVHSSAPATVAQTVAMLVHECSHQYFHMSQWMVPPTTSDAPEVYSVLKNRSRPLERVLLGFHAFGNCTLALARLRDSVPVVDADPFESELRNARRLTSNLLEQLAPHVEKSLEPSGQEFFQPLLRRLQSDGAVTA